MREKTRISWQAQPEECCSATICKIHLLARRKYLTNFAPRPRFPRNRADGISRRGIHFTVLFTRPAGADIKERCCNRLEVGTLPPRFLALPSPFSSPKTAISRGGKECD